MTEPAEKPRTIQFELTDLEYDCLCIIAENSERPEITTVEELLRFHVEYLCEMAFLTVKEPDHNEING